ncbi:hypothetical protein EUX98_g901 [Antrodiella citrinella]|uniref:Carboxymuconolactone decarboxylase-like domain-containing protein n=1 Tax=Antrodiella citrinella TaxID=2447956 RepID=A0A4S4N2R1_9APHY|nr:hypothetical protein EUX98_g901 [Antrodiella citrinella]
MPEPSQPTSSLKDGEGLLPARVPYVFPAPGESEAADHTRVRRAGGPLLALDGVLLNCEPLAAGWNQIGYALRDYNTIPADIRELLVLRVAVLNKATFEWLEHEGPGRKAGLTTADLRAIRLSAPLSTSTPLTHRLAAAQLFADYSTTEVRVPQNVFDALRGYLETDRQMVEAVATVACYNMVSRILVALDVNAKTDVEVPIPQAE